MKNKKYIIFHKPWGVLSQFTSQEGHKTLADFDLPKEIYAAGRLDKDSEGLLLLTNDGVFINKFLTDHPRVYWAQVEGDPSDKDLEQLRKGITLKDGKCLPIEINILKNTESFPPRDPPIRERKFIPTSWLELTLFEGRNRQVRRMTAALNFPTLRLLRVGLGKLKIDVFDDLKIGQWREVKISDLV